MGNSKETLYWISCPECLWKSHIPVTREVVEKFTRLPCRVCQRKGIRSEYVVKEHIPTGFGGIL